MKKILFVFMIVLLAGCKESTTTPDEKNATKVDMAELLHYPGFVNFKTSYDEYEPNAELIDSIKAAFKSSDQKLYLYLKPECSCSATLVTFPKLMKTLDEAGIPQSNIMLYVMNDMTYNYPEKHKISLTDLPEFFVENNTSIINITEIPDKSSIEQVVFNSLK